MTTGASTTSAPTPPTPGGAVHVDQLDPANQSLADALRMSFRILKLLMLGLLGLYFLSGWFSVKPNEVGLVLRYGRIVGASATEEGRQAVLIPGWHWSWPYPFEEWITVPAPKSERQIDVNFMFQLSEAEETSGIKGYRYDNLSPDRDDYLITGDVNIIHASLIVKYHITDAVAYVQNVFPMPDPDADVRSKAYRRYPEYTVLRDLTRDAVIETAARREALNIRGQGQEAFLVAVAVHLNKKLDALEAAGASLGITVDSGTGIIAPKKEGVEAIMPPRQTQEVFDKVLAAQAEKSREITKAESEREALLVNTAGPEHEQLAAAIEAEFALMRAISVAERSAASAENTAEIQRLGVALAGQRLQAETLLSTVASGNVRALLRGAQIMKDRIIKEAAGDYQQFIVLRPEYEKNPEIFRSRLLDETYAMALDSKKVIKLYVPPDHLQVRLKIPRGGMPPLESEEEKKKAEAANMGLGSSFR